MCGKGHLQADSARSSTSNLSAQLNQQPSPALSPEPEEGQHPFFDYKDERAHLHVSTHSPIGVGGLVLTLALSVCAGPASVPE